MKAHVSHVDTFGTQLSVFLAVVCLVFFGERWYRPRPARLLILKMSKQALEFGMFNVALNDFVGMGKNWRVWQLLAKQDIEMRYRRSIIGPFWISITIAIMVLALSYLYSHLFSMSFGEFMPAFAIGLVIWTYIASVINEGNSIILENESIIRNVPMPMSSFAARMVLRNLIVMGHNAIAIAIILMFFGFKFSALSIFALPALVVYVLLGLFLSILLGPLCARFRDTQQIIANITQIMFFFTPIMWQASMVKSRPLILDLNPFYHLIEIARAPILGNHATIANWSWSLAIVLVLFLACLPALGLVKKRLFLWL